MLQTVGVYSAAYGTVHYKEPLKSFEIRVGHIFGFGLPSVAILSRLCRKRLKAIFTHSQSVSQRHTFTWPNYLLKSQQILLVQALKRLTLCMYGSPS